MKMRKVIFSIISILIVLAGFSSGYAQGSRSALIVFHSLTCHRCIEIKNEVMPDIENKFKDKISIEYRDINKGENFKFLLALREKYKSDVEMTWPLFFLWGHFLNGKEVTKVRLTQFINESLVNPIYAAGELPEVDLAERFKNFKVLAIIGAALLDGINPCAFTVIVFFISFLALQGYKKRELIIVGLSFIFAIFLTYVLIGVGIFLFLYSISGVWLAAKIFNFAVGILSFALGVLCFYDAFKYKTTRDIEGLILQLPRTVKNKIHQIIGLHYRTPHVSETPVAKKYTFTLFLSALTTGFLVSILEFVCTGQVYLPTITAVLKITHLRYPAFSYLLLYNFLFIVPLFAIFLLALFGATSEDFTKFLRKHLLLVKLSMAVLFFFLGAYVIWGDKFVKLIVEFIIGAFGRLSGLLKTSE